LGAPPGFEAVLAFSSGRLEDNVVLEGTWDNYSVLTSQIESIAQTMANYINRAGLGS